jgi:hypothetical protein
MKNYLFHWSSIISTDELDINTLEFLVLKAAHYTIAYFRYIIFHRNEESHQVTHTTEIASLIQVNLRVFLLQNDKFEDKKD